MQAGLLTDASTWLHTAIETERLGFDAFYVADHLGVTPSPFAALAAAAGATTKIKLGTYVLNTGVRDPVTLASDAATLDVLSNGRAILGLGAGHTPAEWTMTGREYPTAADRVGRLIETVTVVAALLRGEVVTHHGQFLHIDDGYVLSPIPRQRAIPLLIGGNGPDVLRLAGSTADIVSLTGLGRTLEDGHRHTVDWSIGSIDERVMVARDAAVARDHAPVLDALVQHIEITDRRDQAAEAFATTAPGLTASQVLGAPYALIGTVDELTEELLRHQQRWGFTSYVIRADAMTTAAELLRHLSSD